MSSNEYFQLLPMDYEGEIKYKILTVHISASTTQDEYRCRSMGTHSIRVYDDEDNLLYHYSDDYRDSPQKRESKIKEVVGENLGSVFNLDCPYGKTPEIEVNLNENYYSCIDEDYDEDRSMGHVHAEYQFKLHIFE